MTLRAKGTLISEPRFSTPCDMRFSPRDTGKKWPFSEDSLQNGHFPSIAWGKSHIARGRNRGSLISVP